MRIGSRSAREILLALLLSTTSPAIAQQAAVRGEVHTPASQGFARIVLAFGEPVTATAQVAGGVMILHFDRPVQLRVEQLATALPAYVSAARLDPDRRALRIALVRAVRADLKDAAEDLYLDLIPAEWRGAPPSLPAPVVARLAERVRARTVAAPVAPGKPRPAAVTIAVARSDSRLRLTFGLPDGVRGEAEQRGARVAVTFTGDAVLDAPALRAALAGAVTDLSVEPESRRLSFVVEQGVELRAAGEDGALALDLEAPGAMPRGVPAPAPAAVPTAQTPPAPTPSVEEPAAAPIASASAPASPLAATSHDALVFDADVFARHRRGAVREQGYALLQATAEASKRQRTAARLDLALFHLANKNAAEARGVLSVAAMDDPKAAMSAPMLLMRALAAFLGGDLVEAGQLLGERALEFQAEAALLRAALDARAERHGRAHSQFRGHDAAFDAMPDVLQAEIRPLAIEAALVSNDLAAAAMHLSALEKLDGDDREPALVPLFQGMIDEASGRADEAILHYAAAAQGPRPVEAEARLRKALLQHARGLLPAAAARQELETLAMIWRRSPQEVRAQSRLAEIAAGEGRWRDAFTAMRRAVEILPDHPVTRTLQDEMGRRFAALFLGGGADSLPKVEALAIFDEFRALIPPGPTGDAIVRRLSDRLIDLDLLPQAAELLTHQVDHRLKGAARAEAAARLALLHLMEDKPAQALAALRGSRYANITPELKQMRLHLEARTLSLLSQPDVALEMLAADEGREAERLRADIFWRARRWSDAAVAYERALGERWREAAPLSPEESGDILRAAIGHVLASDGLGADRVRLHFLSAMEKTSEGELFRLVTVDSLSRPGEFRDAARAAASAASLTDLLNAYRKRFPPESAKG